MHLLTIPMPSDGRVSSRSTSRCARASNGRHSGIFSSRALYSVRVRTFR